MQFGALMDPSHYQQYAYFYWQWDYPPPSMYQTYGYQNRGLPGTNESVTGGFRRTNTQKEAVVVDSPSTDDENEDNSCEKNKVSGFKVGACAWTLAGLYLEVHFSVQPFIHLPRVAITLSLSLPLPPHPACQCK